MNKPPPPPFRARPRTSPGVANQPPAPENEQARLEFDDFVPLDDISITPVDSLVPVRMLDLADDLTDDAEDADPDVDATRRRRDRQMMGIGALTAALVFGTTAWWLGGRAARSASTEAHPTTEVVASRRAAPVAAAVVLAVATTASVAPARATSPERSAPVTPAEPSAPATVVPTPPMTAASATTMASPVDSASPVIPAPRRPKRKHPDHVPPTASFPD